MRKWIVIILGLVGLVVVGIVVLRLLKAKPYQTIDPEDRIECNYPGEFISTDEKAEYFIIKYNEECNLCNCNKVEGLICEIVLCLEEQGEVR